MSETNPPEPETPLPANPLDLPKPTRLEMFARALLRGLAGGMLASIGLVTLVGVAGLATGGGFSLFGLAYLGGAAFCVAMPLFFLFGLLGQSRPMQNRTFKVVGFAATFFGLAMLVVFFTGLFGDVAHWLYYQPLLVEQANWVTLKNRNELEDPQVLFQRRRAELRREISEALAEVDEKDEKRRAEVIELYLGSGGRIDEKWNIVPAPHVEKLMEEARGERHKAETLLDRIAVREKYGYQIRNAGGAWANDLYDLETTLEERLEVANRPLRSTDVSSVLHHFLFETPDPSPEAVGIRPALLGSLWLAFLMILFAVPIGVGAALYLEEYRGTGRLARLIQININNLAGVPSIVFGILGAFVFVELIFKPIHLMNHHISVRNVIGGGLTLALLTLPVVIVSAQEAIRAVPNSIRQGAYALGATHWQVIRTQVLPMARPGILTGTILAVSRAIGEAAPLVLFGATTFVAYNPSPISDFTVLPIQIYNWAERSTNPTLDRVAGATADGGVHVFEAMSGRTLGRLRGHEGKVNAVAFNNNGHLLITGGADRTVRVWDAHRYRELDVLRKHEAAVTSVAMNHSMERQWQLSGDERGVAILWKREVGRSVSLEGHKAGITCVALSADGTRAVTGSADQTLILWDAETAKRLAVLEGHTGPVTAVRFAPDETLFSSSSDGSVRQWDEKGKELRVLRGGHEGAVNALAYGQTPNVKRLITGGADGKVLAWDLLTGKVVQAFPEHADEVTAVDILHRQINGNDFLAVVSGSKDETLKYCELSTGREMQTMRGRHGAITSLSLDPVGETINAWHHNMALASLVLLGVLLLLNACAIVLRSRAQQRVRL